MRITPFLFNGRYGVQTDPNGLLYMRARYYNPYICRFINADPSGFSGGLNFFAFADGNPVSLADPFGLCSGVSDDTRPLNWFERAGIEHGERFGQIMDRTEGMPAWTLPINLAGATVELGLQDLGMGLHWLEDKLGGSGSLAALPMLAPEMQLARLGAVESTAVRSASALGETTYNVSFGSTGSRLLDTLGFQSARISNVGVKIDPSLTGADLLNVSAHEAFHVSTLQNFPNFAASAGRLPFIGAFPLYAEEVGAYGVGALRAGQYGQALLSPISAFGSLSLGQSASVLGSGAVFGGLGYYNLTH